MLHRVIHFLAVGVFKDFQDEPRFTRRPEFSELFYLQVKSTNSKRFCDRYTLESRNFISKKWPRYLLMYLQESYVHFIFSAQRKFLFQVNVF